MFNPIRKDILLTCYISLVIYQFRCQCPADYLGITGHCLEVRIVQNVQTNNCKGKTRNLHVFFFCEEDAIFYPTL